jgi:4-amino-4-deoxychorismate lyase
MSVRIIVNGVPTDAVSARDRGFQFGDGLFETFAVKNGAPLLWDRHVARLHRGCERLRLILPDLDLLWREATALCDGTARGALKLILSRGESARGYRYIGDAVPTRVFYLSMLPPDSIAHASMRICRTRLSDNPALAGIKHLNRLEQVLARNEWADEYTEGLMLDPYDNVIEATAANVFAVIDGTLRTPDLSRCGVAGVMRDLVLERCAPLGIFCQVARLSLSELRNAQEIFLTSSIIGVLPVTTLDGRQYEVGPIAQALRKDIESFTAMA